MTWVELWLFKDDNYGNLRSKILVDIYLMDLLKVDSNSRIHSLTHDRRFRYQPATIEKANVGTNLGHSRRCWSKFDQHRGDVWCWLGEARGSGRPAQHDNHRHKFPINNQCSCVKTWLVYDAWLYRNCSNLFWNFYVWRASSDNMDANCRS